MYPVSFSGFSKRQNQNLEYAGLSCWERRAEKKAAATAPQERSRDEFKEYVETYRNVPLTTLYSEIVSQFKSYIKAPFKFGIGSQERYHAKRMGALNGLLVERLQARKNWPVSELDNLINHINSYTKFQHDDTNFKLTPKRSVYRALKQAKAQAVALEKQQTRIVDVPKPIASIELSPYDETREAD